MTQTHQLPPAPPVWEPQVATPSPAAPPRKRGRWIVLGAVVLGLGALATAGALSNTEQDGSTSTTVEAPDPVEPAAPSQEELVGQAAAESVTYAGEGSRELEAGYQAAQAYDLQGAATHLDNAGDAYSAIAGVWAGVDDQISTSASAAAGHMHAAASDLRAGRINAATQELDAGLIDMEAMNAATEAYL